MSRGINSTTKTHLDDQVLIPIFLIELDFESAPLRVWTGYGDYSWNGYTWKGLGDLFSISELEETKDVIANGMSLQLDGIKTDLIYYALADNYRGRSATIYEALVEKPITIIGEPWIYFRGLMDHIEVQTGGDTSSLVLHCESKMISLGKAEIVRYTDQAQQQRHPGDKGLEYVTGLANTEIKWGRV